MLVRGWVEVGVDVCARVLVRVSMQTTDNNTAALMVTRLTLENINIQFSVNEFVHTYQSPSIYVYAHLILCNNTALHVCVMQICSVECSRVWYIGWSAMCVEVVRVLVY